MLSISRISSAGETVKYFFSYYANDTTFTTWVGKGAETLGLSGSVGVDDFKKILEGKLDKLTQIGKRENGEIKHAPGLDLTFSAPKSVSILAEVLGDERIKDAHNEAVSKVLKYIEENLTYTRVKKDGVKSLEKVDNIISAQFRHSTSRNHDPQLHTHVVLANVVIDRAGKWKSAYLKEIFNNKKLLGLMYRSELAYSLKELGFHVERTHEDGRFELREIPKELINTFSSRSAEIQEALKEYEFVNAVTAAQATLYTRESKQEIPREILLEKWQEVLNKQEFNLETQKEKIINEDKELSKILDKQSSKNSFINGITNLLNELKQKLEFNFFAKVKHIDQEQTNVKEDIKGMDDERVATMAVNYGIGHLSERATIFKEKDLLTIASSYSLGRTPVSRVIKAIEDYKKEEKLLTNRHNFTLTTKEGLKRELENIKLMKDGKESFKPVCSKEFIQDKLKETTLYKTQKEAVKFILSNKDFVVGIQGHPGVGKTHMMSYAREIAEEYNYEFIGLAPSASAAAVLTKDANINSMTISKFLGKYQKFIDIKSFDKELLNLKESFTNKIVLVDEVSLSSTHQINSLLKLTNNLNVRLVLCGDKRQLDSPEAGKPFEQLQKAGMPTVIMDEIIRQKSPMLRQAVYNALEGNIEHAIEKISRGVEITEKKAFASRAAEIWLSLSEDKRTKTIVTAPLKSTRKEINDLIREGLSREEKIKGAAIELNILDRLDATHAQMRTVNSYQEGYVVKFLKDYSSLGISRDDILTVESIKSFNTLLLKKENGNQVLWQPHKMGLRSKETVEIYEQRQIKLQPGDSIRWTRNNNKYPDIINATTAKVLSVDDKSIVFKTDNEKSLSLDHNDKALLHLDYAYAGTVHFMQGRTSVYEIAVLDSDHQHLTNQKIFNVIVSRPQQYIKLITDDKKKLIETLYEKTGYREAATEHQEMSYKSLQSGNIDIVNLKVDDPTTSQNKSILPKSTKQNISKTFNETYTTKDIYKNLYIKLSSILPEFGFKYKGGYYISTTSQKIDGSIGKSKGKVYVYSNNPGTLVDYTRNSLSIWEYIHRQYMPNASKSEVMRYLLDQAGLRTKHGNKIIVQAREQIIIEEKKPEVDKKLLADIHNFAKDNMLSKPNEVFKYLTSERGYALETIQKMELGYIDKKQEVGKYLRLLGWRGEKIKEAYKILHLIGKTHNLIIPFKDIKGEVIGLAGRNINHSNSSEIGKYLYTKGLSRSNTILNINNLVPNKEAVIVEGMLDSLHAQAKGVANVFALGGSSFNQSQLKLLKQSGVSTINLCLDNDNAGHEAAKKIVEVIKANGSEFTVKQTKLPHSIKDPDQMLKENGVEAFKSSLSQAATVLNNSLPNTISSGKVTTNNAIINDKSKSIEIEL